MIFCVSIEKADEIKAFLEKDLNVRMPKNYDDFGVEEQKTMLKDRINRPIRICGMVKNEGEPGGGPFWIKDAQGNISLQIIESAQIDMEDKAQAAILQNSTHFNPVDLVCGVRDYKGQKFDLLDLVGDFKRCLSSLHDLASCSKGTNQVGCACTRL